MRGLRAFVVGVFLVALGVVGAPPAAAALPGPVVTTPTFGQLVDYAGDLPVHVEPVSGASGYLYGFFENGAAVWENYANERTLSGTDYTIKAGTPAHEAIKPGPVDIWVRALVNGQWTDATIIKVTFAPASSGSTSPPSNGGQQPPWFCITGPNGAGCGSSNVAPNSKPTWNTYLDWFETLAKGSADAASLTASYVDCNGSGPGKLLGCLGILTNKFPAIGFALDALGCASGARGPAAIQNCMGVGGDGVEALIGAIRAVAAVNPDLRNFLASPMPI